MKFSPAYLLFAVLMVIPASCGRQPPKQEDTVPTLAVAPEPAISKTEQPVPVVPPTEPSTGQEPASAVAFEFPSDTAGKRLSQRLTPISIAMKGMDEPAQQRSRTLPEAIRNPTVSNSDTIRSLPRLPLPAGRDVQPMALPERVPMQLTAPNAQLPDRTSLAHGPLTRAEGVDVRRPSEVPILARPVGDRASLDDPTREYSARFMVSDRLPLRSETTPFIRYTLPEPFEYSASGKTIVIPIENPNRSLSIIPAHR